MRVWKFGDGVPAGALVPATGRCKCWRTVPGVGRRAAARFVLDVAEGDMIFAGRDFGAGPEAERLAEFLDAVQLRAVVAKSFAPEFEKAVFHRHFDLIPSPEAVALYEDHECAPPDDRLIKFILEAGPDATRRTPQVELAPEGRRLVIDGLPIELELSLS